MTPKSRTVFVDSIKSFAVLVTLVLHAALAYSHLSRYDLNNYLRSSAPIIDTQQIIGADYWILFAFTTLYTPIFLLSGLYAYRNWQVDGVGAWLKYRLLRLMLPFLLVVLVLLPLAYYPSFQITEEPVSFFHFYTHFYLAKGGASGPYWLLWWLFSCDLIAVLFYLLLKDKLEKLANFLIGRTPSPTRIALQVIAFFYLGGMVFAIMGWRGETWLPVIGPFWWNPALAFKYLFGYLYGVLLGCQSTFESKLSNKQDLINRSWFYWLTALVILATPVIYYYWYHVTVVMPNREAFQMVEHVKTLNLSQAPWFQLLYAVFNPLLGALALLTLLTASARFCNLPSRIGKFLSTHAYAVFLIHYPIVIYLQKTLLGLSFSPGLKWIVVVILSLPLALGLAWLLRRFRVTD